MSGLTEASASSVSRCGPWMMGAGFIGGWGRDAPGLHRGQVVGEEGGSWLRARHWAICWKCRGLYAEELPA